jgi:hypothetical protein
LIASKPLKVGTSSDILENGVIVKDGIGCGASFSTLGFDYYVI